jgi:hypothetical protein
MPSGFCFSIGEDGCVLEIDCVTDVIELFARSQISIVKSTQTTRNPRVK